jgi:hypothetical protein
MPTHEAVFVGDRILIARYPFLPGSCRKAVSISADEILEADTQHCTLRLKNHIIYLPGWPREDLVAYCASNRVVVRQRYDVWEDILEPFVDTSFTSVQIAARNERLRSAGMSAWRVARLRLLYCLPIVVFQGIAGEWAGLHHYHLLHSLRGLRVLGIYFLPYRHTMNVALEQYRQNANPT